jgi:hypothetical protein
MERIETERKELDRLLGNGAVFEVERPVFVRRKGVFGWLRRRVKTIETLKFSIQEQTLSTLDRISAEQVELGIDESIMQSEAGISHARGLAGKHAKRLARIIALAVMGQDYVIPIQKGARLVYAYDDKRLDELTELFFHNVKPSRLFQYCLLVGTTSNLGDFTNSIRLMSASRTTIPILIEADKGD